MNRVVECGGCDTQFRVTEEIVVQSKKVYPGEKTEPELNRFRRIPSSSIGAPAGMQTINYADFNHPEQLGPASPQRIIAGAFGVIIMLFGAMLLFISTKPNSPLGGMPFEKKLLVAGFTSVLGFVFLLYANPLARFKAAFFGLVLAAGVFAIPFYIRETAIAPGKKPYVANPSDPKDTGETVVDPIQALRERFLLQPLENEQMRLTASSSNKKVYGIYLTELLDRNKLTARDYLVRETRASMSSHPYPRNRNNYLLVLTEVRMGFEEVATVAGTLGKVTETHPEISLMVVQVDNDHFVASPTEKLNDTNHPSFYELNLLELESIDLNRVQQAVERLADSDAKLLRSDINANLNRLLKKTDLKFHDSIARALLKWTDDPAPTAAIALKTLNYYVLQKTSPPEHLVRLVANYKDPAAIPTIISVWKTNTVLWDKEMVKFGSLAELAVLEKINTEQAPLHRAVIKMLGEIGTGLSLPELRKALTAEDPEIRLLAERAIQLIEQR